MGSSIVQAHNNLNLLLPKMEGDKIPSLVLTPEYLDKFNKAEQELKTATAKLRSILEKLWEMNKTA